MFLKHGYPYVRKSRQIFIELRLRSRLGMFCSKHRGLLGLVEPAEHLGFQIIPQSPKARVFKVVADHDDLLKH